MTEYIIRGGVAGRERLALLARAMKPYTDVLLDDCGVKMGMTVLDVGCGGGDVSVEFARRVGPQGCVVGLDLDAVEIGIAREEAATRKLANVDYRSGNLLTDPIADRFDIVYARFLLSHLAAPEQGVAAMVARLKPGGTLIVEDVDFRGHFCHPPRESFARYVALYEQSARARGVDPHLGVRLPSLLAQSGAELLGVRVACPAATEGPVKQMAALTLAAIADTVVGDGKAARQEIDADIADLKSAASDPGVFMSMPRIVQCWGRPG